MKPAILINNTFSPPPLKLRIQFLIDLKNSLLRYSDENICSIQIGTFQSGLYFVRLMSKLKQQKVMSRGRSERKDKNHYEVDRLGRGDPFQEMHQVMKQFGSFGRDDFFSGGFMAPFRDPFEEMMEFSNAHRNLHGSGKEGSYVCQTFVSSSKMGPDGKMKQQSYFQNSAGQNKNGQTISQKHQAYKNNDGVKRIAEERMLNDRGHKIMKQKKGNEIEQTNHYYNMEQHQADRFGQDWRQANNDLKFLENVGRVQQSIANGNGRQQNMPRQIGYQQRRQEPRQEQPQVGYRQQQQSRGGASQKSGGFKDSRRQF